MNGNELKMKLDQEYGIIDNVSHRAESYPKDFYQVLQYLDVVMRKWTGDEMGTDGFFELMYLCNIINYNPHIRSQMPIKAKAFFEVLVNPKNEFEILTKAGLSYSHMFGAYFELRNYLIDNKEKIAESYEAISEHHDKYYRPKEH